MENTRTRYKQVGAKFRSAEDSRALRAITKQDGRRVERDCALRSRRSIPSGLSPVAPLPHSSHVVAGASTHGMARGKENRQSPTGLSVQTNASATKKSSGLAVRQKKTLEQLSKERMEMLKLFKQKKERRLVREKQSRKPNFWTGVANMKSKVLLLPALSDANTSRMRTPSKRSTAPVWHSGFSSISRKGALLGATITGTQGTAGGRVVVRGGRTLFADASTAGGRAGALVVAGVPRVSGPVQAMDSFVAGEDVSFAPTGYRFHAPEGVEHFNSRTAMCSRRTSTVHFVSSPPSNQPKSATRKRMPLIKTPVPGAARQRRSRINDCNRRTSRSTPKSSFNEESSSPTHLASTSYAVRQSTSMSSTPKLRSNRTSEAGEETFNRADVQPKTTPSRSTGASECSDADYVVGLHLSLESSSRSKSNQSSPETTIQSAINTNRTQTTNKQRQSTSGKSIQSTSQTNNSEELCTSSMVYNLNSNDSFQEPSCIIVPDDKVISNVHDDIIEDQESMEPSHQSHRKKSGSLTDLSFTVTITPKDVTKSLKSTPTNNISSEQLISGSSGGRKYRRQSRNSVRPSSSGFTVTDYSNGCSQSPQTIKLTPKPNSLNKYVPANQLNTEVGLRKSPVSDSVTTISAVKSPEDSSSDITRKSSDLAADMVLDGDVAPTTLQPTKKCPVSQRRSLHNSRRSMRLSRISVAQEDATTPANASQRLTAATPCSRSTRRSLAVRAEAPWGEQCDPATDTPLNIRCRRRNIAARALLEAQGEDGGVTTETIENAAAGNLLSSDIHSRNDGADEYLKESDTCTASEPTLFSPRHVSRKAEPVDQDNGDSDIENLELSPLNEKTNHQAFKLLTMTPQLATTADVSVSRKTAANIISSGSTSSLIRSGSAARGRKRRSSKSCGKESSGGFEVSGKETRTSGFTVSDERITAAICIPVTDDNEGFNVSAEKMNTDNVSGLLNTSSDEVFKVSLMVDQCPFVNKSARAGSRLIRCIKNTTTTPRRNSPASLFSGDSRDLGCSPALAAPGELAELLRVTTPRTPVVESPNVWADMSSGTPVGETATAADQETKGNRAGSGSSSSEAEESSVANRAEDSNSNKSGVEDGSESGADGRSGERAPAKKRGRRARGAVTAKQNLLTKVALVSPDSRVSLGLFAHGAPASPTRASIAAGQDLISWNSPQSATAGAGVRNSRVSQLAALYELCATPRTPASPSRVGATPSSSVRRSSRLSVVQSLRL